MKNFSEQVLAIPLRRTWSGEKVCVEADLHGDIYAFAHAPPPTPFEGWEEPAYEMCEFKVREKLAQVLAEKLMRL